MDKLKIRGIDIIAGLIFFILGILILVFAFRMPLKDSFGGVNSVWYVSPALFPIIIGFCICGLAIAIIRYAVKHDGFRQLKQILEQRKKISLFNETQIRFASILMPFCAIVYVNITRIDIFFSVVFFLIYTISVFYLGSMQLMRRMLLVYSIEMGIILILAVSKLDKVLAGVLWFSMDIVALILLIIFHIFLSMAMKKYTPGQKKKLRNILCVSYITPVGVILFFKFMLRIPMPKEGVIVDLFAMVYYALR